jgi:phosphoribosyl 1,2-cyclic phosphate phosphodiesterase
VSGIETMSTDLTAIVLGCGTSHGVPMIGCDCAVCTSEDPRNGRTRSSLFLNGDGYNVLIDCPPEMRLQLCREGISDIDRVLITHSHADHVMGMDDLRRLYEMTHKPVKVWAQPSVLEDISRIYDYAFRPPEQIGGGIPAYQLFSVWDATPGNSILPPDIEVFEVLHGRLPVLGVKVRGFAYLTDVSEIPGDIAPRLEGLETLIIDATRRKPHPTHFNLEQALAVIARLKPVQAYLTHLSHDYDYAVANAKLPAGTELSYDGLRISIA